MAEKLTRQRIAALFEARLKRHDTEHEDHEAALKKMFDTHAKARAEMHRRHQKARREMHADHLASLGDKSNSLHGHPRSPK